jgi:RNA polymerase sigma factor (sigma-70 family)
MTEQGQQELAITTQQYGRRLFGFIRGRVRTDEDAEDILQDVWYQLSRVIEAEPIQELGAWLYRVARNRITDSYRKKKTETLPETITDEDYEQFEAILLEESPDIQMQMMKETFWEELFFALDELPVKQKEVFIKNELEEISFEEIARQTGENIKTLISRKRYAVQFLRERLEDIYDEIINE